MPIHETNIVLVLPSLELAVTSFCFLSFHIWCTTFAGNAFRFPSILPKKMVQLPDNLQGDLSKLSQQSHLYGLLSYRPGRAPALHWTESLEALCIVVPCVIKRSRYTCIPSIFRRSSISFAHFSRISYRHGNPVLLHIQSLLHTIAVLTAAIV